MRRLKTVLKGYGEYPAKYRLFIWRSILRLPENFAAFGSLVDKQTHFRHCCAQSYAAYLIHQQFHKKTKYSTHSERVLLNIFLADKYRTHTILVNADKYRTHTILVNADKYRTCLIFLLRILKCVAAQLMQLFCCKIGHCAVCISYFLSTNLKILLKNWQDHQVC